MLLCLTYQCSNLLLLSKHIVMYSIKIFFCYSHHTTKAQHYSGGLLLGFCTVKWLHILTFWRILLPPSSGWLNRLGWRTKTPWALNQKIYRVCPVSALKFIRDKPVIPLRPRSTNTTVTMYDRTNHRNHLTEHNIDNAIKSQSRTLVSWPEIQAHGLALTGSQRDWTVPHHHPGGLIFPE